MSDYSAKFFNTNKDQINWIQEVPKATFLTPKEDSLNLTALYQHDLYQKDRSLDFNSSLLKSYLTTNSDLAKNPESLRSLLDNNRKFNPPELKLPELKIDREELTKVLRDIKTFDCPTYLTPESYYNSPLWASTQKKLMLEARSKPDLTKEMLEKMQRNKPLFLKKAKQLIKEFYQEGIINSQQEESLLQKVDSQMDAGAQSNISESKESENQIPEEKTCLIPLDVLIKRGVEESPSVLGEVIDNKLPNDEHLDWEEIITKAIDRGTSDEIAELPLEKRAEFFRKEWLIEDPLAGICTGLAVEFMLEREQNKNLERVAPSDNARYWEKLLIPVMAQTMQLYNCESPDDLTEERHYREIYRQMIQIIGEKAHVNASMHTCHRPLEQLGTILNTTQGHSIVVIEKQGTRAAANHTIYFNATSRLISDNDVMIEVPVGIDYGDFVDFYMKKMNYFLVADKFSLISVIKDPNHQTVRTPSLVDQLSLSVEIASLYVFKGLCEVLSSAPMDPLYSQ